MKNNQISYSKEKLFIYLTSLETWKKRELNDINSISFDAVCADLIISNPPNNAPNVPTAITIFNKKREYKH